LVEDMSNRIDEIKELQETNKRLMEQLKLEEDHIGWGIYYD